MPVLPSPPAAATLSAPGWRVDFYLGTHLPHWLQTLGVPLFVSHRRLRERRTLPRAVAPWALDSGAFTELSAYGGWQTTPAEYADAVRRYRDEVGMMAWAAPQDSMCEPFIVTKTGLSVADHLDRTVANYLELRTLAADLPIIPVLQGWSRDDYMRCWDRYDRHGIDLDREAVVGVGSVCRRQATDEVAGIFAALHPLRLHGFGVKSAGVVRYGGFLRSSDSMAWSFAARRDPPLAGHTHKNCANCADYALWWRGNLLHSIRTACKVAPSYGQPPEGERMDGMADKAKEGATATTTRNRQVISLPADLAERVNRKGREMSEAVKAVTRVDPNLSLTDVAQSLLIQALDAADAEVAATAENGDKAA